MSIPTPPPDVALWLAYARSCRPAWEAAHYGDSHPDVLEQARVYRDWIGEQWPTPTRTEEGPPR